MRFVVITALVLLLIPAATACIYEYREVVFYPNGSEKIGRDWIVVNFSNPYSFQLYDIELTYRGARVYLPSIPPGETLKMDPYTTLPPERIPIGIHVEVSGRNVTYIIRNDLDDDLTVNVSLPLFTGFAGCQGCTVKGRIVFTSDVAAKGSSSFTIRVNSSTFRIPDGKVEFRVKKSIPVSYGVDLGISVEKKRVGNEWYATFRISNPLSRDINVSFEAWYAIDSQRYDLFNETLQLKAGENVSIPAPPVVSDTAPVFYIRARAHIQDLCEVSVVPATKNGKNYIVGYAVLSGFAGVEGGGGIGAVGGAVSGERVEGGGAAQSQQPQQSAQPVPFSLRPPKIVVPKISREEATNYVAMMLPAAYGLFFATVLFPLMTRRGVVVDRDIITPRNYSMIRAYGRRLYTTPSGAFPGCIVVEPDESVVERLMDLGLRRKDAECIAAAIKIKKPLLTSDRKVAEIASRNGCMVILIGA